MIEAEHLAAEADSFWYALKVHSRGLSLRDLGRHKLDFPVVEIMRRRGLDPFVPVESIFIRHNRYHLAAKKRVKRALLPGMVFLHLEEPVNWWLLASIPLVSGIFGFGGRPYRFASSGIDRLMAISDDLYQPDHYRPMPTRRAYDVGDDVIDLTGRFEGAMTVTEIKGETARILVPFFGEMREATVAASMLAKAAE